MRIQTLTRKEAATITDGVTRLAARTRPLRSSLLRIFHPFPVFHERLTRWLFWGEIAISTARCTSAIAVTPISLRHARSGEGRKKKEIPFLHLVLPLFLKTELHSADSK